MDGKIVKTLSGSTYSTTWDTHTAGDGAHTIFAQAHDGVGASGVSDTIEVRVDNGLVGAQVSVHTTLGLPDAATTSTTDTTHFLSVKRQYALSYDSQRKVPNWVSWELNTSWFGAQARTNNYRVDDTLPGTLPQAQLADYAGSGYDRGHLCPAEDRTLNLTDDDATFYLTNMVPQLHANNAGPWEGLEAKARGFANAGKEVFVIAGGVFTQGGATIGAGQVAVPASVYKVVVVLDQVGQGPADVTSSTRVLAVNIPNDASVTLSSPWQSYLVSVRSLESATGLDFLSEVPRAVQDVVETRVDSGQ
ncbi:MAG: DNA/RNA non-specific endonuclease [Deltaproteobacteria bacterium]|nr:DNA/RNA non-specific endonuclease [Deltaproteobacteria bacterium]